MNSFCFLVLSVLSKRLFLNASPTGFDLKDNDVVSLYQGNYSRWQLSNAKHFKTQNPEFWWKLDWIVPFYASCKQFTESNPDPKMASRGWKLSELVAVINSSAEYKHLLPARKFVINYGAACSYGGLADPTFDLLQDDAIEGILIDGQIDEIFFSKYPRRHNLATKKGVDIAVNDVLEFLDINKAPKDLLALKIDIDSWECPILEQLFMFGNYTSVIIHVEFNPVFPPPIRFRINEANNAHFSSKVWQLKSLFYGCSLASISDILVPLGYALLETDGWDATFVHNKYIKLFEPIPANLHVAYLTGFWQRFSIHDCFRSNPKLYDQIIYNLVLSLNTKSNESTAVTMGDLSTVQVALHELRSVISAAAPKSVNNTDKLGFYISNRGASDLYYKHRYYHSK